MPWPSRSLLLASADACPASCGRAHCHPSCAPLSRLPLSVKCCAATPVQTDYAPSRMSLWQGTESAHLSGMLLRTASLVVAPLHGFLAQSYQRWILRTPIPAPCVPRLTSVSLQSALALRLCVLVWLAGARLHAGRIAGPHVLDDAAWIAHQSRSHPAASQSAVRRKLDMGSVSTCLCLVSGTMPWPSRFLLLACA